MAQLNTIMMFRKIYLFELHTRMNLSNHALNIFASIFFQNDISCSTFLDRQALHLACASIEMLDSLTDCNIKKIK